MFQEFANFLLFKRFVFLIYVFFTEHLGLIGNPVSHSFQCVRASKTHGWVRILILNNNNKKRCLAPKKLFCSQKYPWKFSLYKNIGIMVLNNYCSELVRHEMFGLPFR